MWNPLQALLPSPKTKQLTIGSYGQETCGLPFEQIQEVMKWLGMSLLAAGYQAEAHIIWDGPAADANRKAVIKNSLRHHEPVFLYRLSDHPMPPPAGYYWRLVPEYPTLRVYQLELKND